MARLFLLIGLVIGTLPFLGASSSAQSTSGSWSQFRHNPERTGHNPAETLLSRQTAPSLTTKWTYTAGGEVRTSAAVVEGAVFAATTGRESSGDPYGRLFSLDATTGAHRWSAQVGDFILSSPAVVAGRVFFGTGAEAGRGSSVRALDAGTGNPVWTFPIPGYAHFSSPTVVNGALYIGTRNDNSGTGGFLYSLDAASGEQRWVYEGGGMSGSPAVANGTVYIGSGKNIVALDAVSGRERWTVETSLPINSSPAVDGSIVYIAANNDFYAINAATGQVNWRAPVGNVDLSSPAIAGGMAYVGGRDGGVWAFDQHTGAFRWKFSTAAGIESSPAVANGVVVIGTGDGDAAVYALDAESGAVLWSRTPTLGAFIDSSPAVVGGMIYIGSSDGKLYAFAVSGAEVTTTTTSTIPSTTTTMPRAGRVSVVPAAGTPGTVFRFDYQCPQGSVPSLTINSDSGEAASEGVRVGLPTTGNGRDYSQTATVSLVGLFNGVVRCNGEIVGIAQIEVTNQGLIAVAPNEGKPGTTFRFSFSCLPGAIPSLQMVDNRGNPLTDGLKIGPSITGNGRDYVQPVTINRAGYFVGVALCSGLEVGRAPIMVSDLSTLRFTERTPAPNSVIRQDVDASKLMSVDGIARMLSRPDLPLAQRRQVLGVLRNLLTKANLHPIRHAVKVCASLGEELDASATRMFIDGRDVTPFVDITPASGAESESCTRLAYHKYWLEGEHSVRVTARTTEGTIGEATWTFRVETHYFVATTTGIAKDQLLDRLFGNRVKHVLSFLEFLVDPGGRVS